METVRSIERVLTAQPALEGAGVRLKRLFGFDQVPLLDPFLLLDDFHSDRPEDYSAGFPWHPHRGIETVTYMIHGKVKHGDSIGNSGVIESGDVQWMTAGSGIIHSEMPDQDTGLLHGLQLWVNLPARDKMMEPRYRDITRDRIPQIELSEGVLVRIICGTVNGVEGPARDIVVSPEYLDVTMLPGMLMRHPVLQSHRAFAYIIDGGGWFSDKGVEYIGTENIVVFTDGDSVTIRSGERGLRLLLISGRPLGETVAWQGPIVMNTREELRRAFDEYRSGKFIRH